MKTHLLLASLILLAADVACAQSVPSIAVFVDGARGKASQTVKAALQTIATSETRTIVRTGVLKKKLRAKPTKLVRRCKQEVTCLAGLGEKGGADFVLLVAVVGAEAVVSLISVAEGTQAAQTTVAPIERERLAAEVESMLGLAVAKASGGDASAEDIAEAELAVAVGQAPAVADEASQASVERAESLPLEPIAQTEPTAAIAPVEASMVAVEVEPAGFLGYRMTMRTWVGAGGVALGATGFIIGSALRGRAERLRELPLRATQLEVVEQQKSQNGAAIGSTVSHALGAAFMAAGIALVVWDVFDGWGVGAAPQPEGGVAMGAVTAW